MFTSIEIDFDVFKELTVRRESPNVTENDVLRKVLGLQPLESDGMSTNGGPPNDNYWVWKGATLPSGTELRAEYSGRVFNARIENGAIVYEGNSFKSPSAAATSVTGSSVNGWIFWEYKYPGKNKWALMDDLRQG